MLIQLSNAAKGTSLPTARLEMCRPDEDAGHCTLQLDLSTVRVTDVQVSQGATDAAARIELAFAKEKFSYQPGSPGSPTVEYDLTTNTVVTGSSGSAPSSATGTPYTTTVTGTQGGKALAVLPTRSWALDVSNPSSGLGGGGGGSKASFSDVTAETGMGPGTIALVRALVTGQRLSQVSIEGCETAACTATAQLSNVEVTELDLGSPSLYDTTSFAYQRIRLDRDDDTTDGTSGRTFTWDLTKNTP